MDNTSWLDYLATFNAASFNSSSAEFDKIPNRFLKFYYITLLRVNGICRHFIIPKYEGQEFSVLVYKD
jgi:hypothetical protein